MIYCPQCGNPNFDDANYCDTCGEPLVNAEKYAQMQNAAQMREVLEQQRQQREAQAYNRAYRKAQKEAKKAAKVKGASGAGAQGPQTGAAAGASGTPGAGAGAYGAAGAAPGQQPGTPGAGFAPGQGAQAGAAAGAAAAGAPEDFTLYKHGCLAQAWDDITETRGWGGKIVALGLINMVPVLNFFVTGFAMKWAAQLPHDKVEPMPAKIFGDGVFLQGFYAIVLTFVLSFVTGLASGLVGIIPFLGALCAMAIGVFMGIFEPLAIMRVAIWGNLARGFDIKQIWQAIVATFKNGRFGKLFCATILPGVIVGCAILFVCGSVLIIFGLNSLTALIGDFQSALQYQQQMQAIQGTFLGEMYSMMDPMMGMGYDPMALVINQMLGLIPLFFVLYLLSMFLLALSQVLTLRATAHYIARYQTDWCVF